MRAVALSADDVHALVQLAHVTDATATLRPFLLSLGVPAAEIGPARNTIALDAWNRRVRAVGYEAWFLKFAQTPKRRWPRTLWHALVLTDDEIHVYSNVPPGSGGLLRLRLRRIGRGLAGVPRTVRAMARERRRGERVGRQRVVASTSAGTTIVRSSSIWAALRAFAALPRR
jgi:hypothetical protein